MLVTVDITDPIHYFNLPDAQKLSLGALSAFDEAIRLFFALYRSVPKRTRLYWAGFILCFDPEVILAPLERAKELLQSGRERQQSNAEEDPLAELEKELKGLAKVEPKLHTEELDKKRVLSGLLTGAEIMIQLYGDFPGLDKWSKSAENLSIELLDHVRQFRHKSNPSAKGLLQLSRQVKHFGQRIFKTLFEPLVDKALEMEKEEKMSHEKWKVTLDGVMRVWNGVVVSDFRGRHDNCRRALDNCFPNAFRNNKTKERFERNYCTEIDDLEMLRRQTLFLGATGFISTNMLIAFHFPDPPPPPETTQTPPAGQNRTPKEEELSLAHISRRYRSMFLSSRSPRVSNRFFNFSS